MTNSLLLTALTTETFSRFRRTSLTTSRLNEADRNGEKERERKKEREREMVSIPVRVFIHPFSRIFGFKRGVSWGQFNPFSGQKKYFAKKVKVNSFVVAVGM